MDRTRWIIAFIATVLVAVVAQATIQHYIYLPIIKVDPTLTPTITPTVTVTPTPTKTLTPTPTKTPDTGLQITDINNGSSNDDLQDEYIKIKNYGSSSVNMKGWFIKTETGLRYDFPDTYKLSGNATVTVWSKTGTDSGNTLYWNSATPVWNNGGDCAYLRDNSDNDNVLVDVYCYQTAADGTILITRDAP